MNQTVYRNEEYEVLTENGWVDFEGMVITHDQEVIDLVEYNLKCTINHKVKLEDNFIEAKELDHIVLEGTHDVYDLLNVDKGNHYITNEITSHNCVYIDEGAFLRNDMKFYESTYPTIASGKETKVIVTSTPNGMRGLFYKLWTESLSGQNSYINMKVDWTMVPGRDEAWRAETIANTSLEQFRQEQELVFRGSENSLISGSVLERLIIKKPIQSSEDGLKIYDLPVKGNDKELPHEYVMIVDVSRGLGLDYNSFTVIDITAKPHEVVCTYKNNKLATLLYPSYIYNVATTYNKAHILVELNDIGEQVANTLYHELEYENMLCVVKDKGRQTIGFLNNALPGVRTSKQVKAVGCSNAKNFIEKNQINLNDEGLINEMGTMVPKGGSYAADDGANDDQAMTIVLYSWAMVQPYFVDLTDQDARKRLLESVRTEREEDVIPFGFIESNEFGSFSDDSYNEWNNFNSF